MVDFLFAFHFALKTKKNYGKNRGEQKFMVFEIQNANNKSLSQFFIF